MTPPKFASCTVCSAPIEVKQIKKVMHCAGCKRDKVREQDAKYYAENRDKVRERQAKYYNENRDEHIKRCMIYERKTRARRNKVTSMILINQLEGLTK